MYTSPKLCSAQWNIQTSIELFADLLQASRLELEPFQEDYFYY
jgi:hypothetical protein